VVVRSGVAHPAMSALRGERKLATFAKSAMSSPPSSTVILWRLSISIASTLALLRYFGADTWPPARQPVFAVLSRSNRRAFEICCYFEPTVM
jgi:hypothetical protein